MRRAIAVHLLKAGRRGGFTIAANRSRAPWDFLRPSAFAFPSAKLSSSSGAAAAAAEDAPLLLEKPDVDMGREGSSFVLAWQEGGKERQARFEARWLWHNAPAHRDPDSGQLTLDPCSFANTAKLHSVRLSEDGKSVTVWWWPAGTAGSSKQYERTFSCAELLRLRYGDTDIDALIKKAQPPVFPDTPSITVQEKETTDVTKEFRVDTTVVVKTVTTTTTRPSTGKGSVPTFAYEDIVKSEEAVYEWLMAINKCGLTLITGAPETPPPAQARARRDDDDDDGCDGTTVTHVASRIASPQRTLYGSSWEVSVMPQPINIAYSPVSLALHSDLAYYESPPGLQLLHCTRFDESIKGGESTFMDGLAAARDFCQHHPEEFLTLATLPTTFQKIHYKRARPAHMVAAKPIFEINYYGLDRALRKDGKRLFQEDADDARELIRLRPEFVIGINWSPQFEGPLRIAQGNEVERYYDAYTCFVDFLEKRQQPDTGLLVEFRMQPGEISVFNNRRMLHGRRHFTSSAAADNAQSQPQRVLKGCYINIDDYRSRLAHLRATIGASAKGSKEGKDSPVDGIHLVCNGNFF